MRRRVYLEIHREDHKNDALGLVFLGALEPERCLELLKNYLGPHAKLKQVEVDDSVLRVEADVREFAEESQNLVRMARDMMRAGRMKGALGQFEEALRLSPLNEHALKGLGRLYYRSRQRDEARYYLTRAREVAPDDCDVLRLLAEIALHDERPLAAREYLELLLQMDPNDKRARTAHARLMPEDARRIRETIAEDPPSELRTTQLADDDQPVKEEGEPPLT
ncbi:MAG: tetratricopeptide repeat protein [Candidatus Binatia bacterium]|nr:tetratricopeptide repeat protein [Candidatus Binatia bacterium]